MATSLRWAYSVLALLAFQVGCCTVHFDYETPYCGRGPVPCNTGCEEGCGINGLQNLRGHLAAWHNHVVGDSYCNSGCRSGCGEVYWDEYINEPPTCDPCGCNNEWTGATCGTCRPWFARLRDMWGYRYVPSDGCGCGECGVSYGASHGIHANEGEIIEERGTEEVVVPRKGDGVPTPAKPKEQSLIPPAAGPADSNVPANGASSGVRRLTPKVVGSGVERVAKSTTVKGRPSVDHSDARVVVESEKKIQAKPTSGRKRLTTQNHP